MMGNDDLVLIEGLYLQRATTKAYGVSYAPYDEIELWIPKSLCGESTLRVNELGTLEVRRWFAEKEELNYEE